MLHIEHDEDGGCFRLIDNGIGMCTSKSRTVLIRIRDALNAVRETGLVGATVEHRVDTIPNRIDGFPRGVVLALCSGPPQLVVRLADDTLDTWLANSCRIITPPLPPCETPGNEPPIGVRTAITLLERWLLEARGTDGIESDTRAYLAARAAAEPTP